MRRCKLPGAASIEVGQFLSEVCCKWTQFLSLCSSISKTCIPLLDSGMLMAPLCAMGHLASGKLESNQHPTKLPLLLTSGSSGSLSEDGYCNLFVNCRKKCNCFAKLFLTAEIQLLKHVRIRLFANKSSEVHPLLAKACFSW